jgi:hypothetical protein
MGNGRKIGIIFVLVALLPVLIYSAYELSSLSSTEELIQSIYSKQLDVAQSWSGEINTLLITSQPSHVGSDTRIFLNKRAAVHGVFYTDSTGHTVSFVTRQTKEKARSDEDISVSSLQNQSATIEKLLRYASSGYRKICNESIHNPERSIPGWISIGISRFVRSKKWSALIVCVYIPPVLASELHIASDNITGRKWNFKITFYEIIPLFVQAVK